MIVSISSRSLIENMLLYRNFIQKSFYNFSYVDIILYVYILLFGYDPFCRYTNLDLYIYMKYFKEDIYLNNERKSKLVKP